MSSFTNDLLEDYGTLNPSDVPLTLWEKRIHALLVVLSTAKPSSLLTTDELRRGVEGLEQDSYRLWGYYDRWAAAMTTILLERGVITEDALHQQLYGDIIDIEPLFSVGDCCRVKHEDQTIRWRKPHLRTPGYIYGLHGIVTHIVGVFDDPSLKAFRSHGPKQPLYRIAIAMKDVLATQYFNSKHNSGNSSTDNLNDTLEIEVYQPWLELYHDHDQEQEKEKESTTHLQLEHNDYHGHDHDHGHGHNHDHTHKIGHEHEQGHDHTHSLDQDHSQGRDHGHGHEHEGRVELEERAVTLEGSSDISPGCHQRPVPFALSC